MKNYFNIQVQGKWVECKKALPRVIFPNDVNCIMKNATLMNFQEIENEQLKKQQHKQFELHQYRAQQEQRARDEQQMQEQKARERLDLIAHHQERLRDLLRGTEVLGERSQNNFQQTREIAIDDEGLTLPIVIDEPLFSSIDKENIYQGNISAGKDVHKFRDQNEYYQMPGKGGVKDPRRRNFIQTTGKGSNILSHPRVELAK